MPSQLGEEHETAQKVLGNITASIEWLTYIELTLSFLLNISLNQILGYINTMQIIVLFPLFKIQMPANAEIYFAQIMKIAAFDFANTSPALDFMLGLEESDISPRTNLQTLGFESILMLHNMGSLLLFFAFYPVALLFTWLCSKVTCSQSVREWGVEQQKKLRYGFLISLVTEAYSVMAISCCIHFKYMAWNSFGNTVESLAALACAGLLIAVPLFIATFINKNFEHLEEKEFKEKYGMFYNELDLSRGRMVLL